MAYRSFGKWVLVPIFILGWSVWPSQSQSPVLGGGRGIDHLEIVVRDLSSTADIYHNRLGFTLGPHGKFPAMGMENAVVWFKNKTYFELISVYDRERAAKSQADEIAFLDKHKHEGAMALGLEIASADKTAAYLRAKGFDIVGPVGGTFTPDGVKQAPPELWKDVLFKKPAVPGDSDTIFFYEYHHEVWRKLQDKYPHLRDDPAKFTHANGAQDIHAVWMCVKNLDEATKAYEAVGFLRGAEMTLPAIGASAQEFQAGDGTILLVSPSSPAGAAAKFLSGRGESVMGVSIEVESVEKTRSVLKEGLHQDLPIYSGPYGKSVVVPGDFTSGVWIEFFERRTF
jgi:catechol 2,3-dioxygenase-like lactoylglutathione lyase family enzyme